MVLLVCEPQLQVQRPAPSAVGAGQPRVPWEPASHECRGSRQTMSGGETKQCAAIWVLPRSHLQAKMQKGKRPARDPRTSRELEFRTWRDDPAERARRVWRWWQKRIVGAGRVPFPKWVKALRLVALTRPSSAAAERAFSHLKRIVDALGKGCLWDELEARMMRRANPQDIREVDGTLPTH